LKSTKAQKTEAIINVMDVINVISAKESKKVLLDFVNLTSVHG